MEDIWEGLEGTKGEGRWYNSILIVSILVMKINTDIILSV